MSLLIAAMVAIVLLLEWASRRKKANTLSQATVVAGRDALGRRRYKAFAFDRPCTHTWDKPGDMGPCIHRWAWVARMHARSIVKANNEFTLDPQKEETSG